MPGHVELAGSHRHQRGRKPVAALARYVPLTIGLHLKTPDEPSGSTADLATFAKGTTLKQLAGERRSQYARAVREVRKFAGRHGIDIVDVDFGRRRVRLRGTAAQLTAAFDANLASYRDERGHYHSHQGPLGMPEELAPWIRGILGFDSRPRLHRPLQSYAVSGAAAGKGLWPADIARLYGIEAPGRGLGQCIAVIAPRGGYLPDDLELAAQHIGAAFPSVAEVSVDNGRNAFGGGTTADQEVALDLQVAGAIAPAARLVIYFTDDSEQGLADAVLEAVHDTTHRPDVIAISWGASEADWSSYQPALDVLNAALADSVQLGVAVTAAAGDMLATNAAGDDRVHVNYPASSPYVLSCGGTRMTLDAAGTSIASETVWNDGNHGTGGGVSELFDVPDYQQGVTIPASISTQKTGRGVPDVAAAAAFSNGYRIFANRKQVVQGGTSAVAPLWAGLIALLKAESGSTQQRLHAMLYGDPTLLRPIVTGNNKDGPLGYEAGPGWNPCTGLGTPLGANILSKMKAVS